MGVGISETSAGLDSLISSHLSNFFEESCLKVNGVESDIVVSGNHDLVLGLGEILAGQLYEIDLLLKDDIVLDLSQVVILLVTGLDK